MPSEGPSRTPWTHWLAIAGTFALLTAWSWRKWPDVVVDFGHQLYIPWRLTEGEALYRDIVYPLGPASQYFTAAWFAVFGPSLMTAVAANLVVLAVLVLLLHAVLRRLGDRTSALVGVLFFLVVFGFSQYGKIANYNYMTPYRHEVTHGFLLCVFEAWCLLNWRESTRRPWLAAAGLAFGMTLIVKAEFALPAAGMLAWTALTARGRQIPATGDPATRPALASQLSTLAVVTGAAVPPTLVAWGLLCLQMSPGQALEALVAPWRLVLNPELTTRAGFYQALQGFDQPRLTAENCAFSLGSLASFTVLVMVLDRLLHPLSETRLMRGTAGGILFLLAFLFVPFYVWDLLPQSLALVDAATLAVCVRNVFRTRPQEGEPADPRAGTASDRRRTDWFGLGLWATLSLLLAAKMLLTLGWGHYGFVLAAPSALLMLHLAVHELPDWLHARTGRGAMARMVVCSLLAACAASLFVRSARIYFVRTLPLGHGADQYLVERSEDVRSVPIHRMLEYLEKNMRRDETLLVVPDGTMVNFLLRKRNPTGHVLLSPWESAAFGDRRIFEDVRRHPPDVVVLFSEDMSIHGRGNFGSPLYGAELSRWIEREYRIVQVFETRRPFEVFQAVVYRSK